MGGVCEEGAPDKVLRGSGAHMAHYQMVDLEDISYTYLLKSVTKTALLLGLLWCHQAPILASAHRHNLARYPSIIQQMLLYRYPALLLVQSGSSLAAPELDVEVGDMFIQDTACQRWLHLAIPHILRIQVEVAAKAARQDHATGELRPKLRRYGEPTLVIQLAFEVIHGVWRSLQMNYFVFVQWCLFFSWLPTFFHYSHYTTHSHPHATPFTHGVPRRTGAYPQICGKAQPVSGVSSFPHSA